MMGNRNRAAGVRDEKSPAPLADPYLEWASAASFDVMSIAGDWVPLLVELNDGIRLADFASRPWLTSRDLLSAVRVPVLYRAAPQGLAAATVCTVLVRAGAFREVIADPGWNRNIKRFGFGLPLSNVPSVRPSPARRARGVRPTPQQRPVVIGVIDDGLAFAHERFCETGQTTRIQYLWNQESAAAPPPATVPYGRELKGADIDRALNASLAGGQIDDSDVYHQLRHEDYRNGIHKAVGRRIAHGTHVMDLAAAVASPFTAAARPIIAVQVSSKVTGDTSGAHLTAAVLDGIWYILNRADRLAPRGSLADVVINVSYGMLAGPHDGSHALEIAIDQIVRGREEQGAKLAVVLPVGNDRLSRCHATFRLLRQGQQTLRWRTLPDDRTPSSLEIWLPPPSHGTTRTRVRVTVIDPSGRPVATVREGETFPRVLRRPVPCYIHYASPPDARGARRITVILQPSAPPEPLDPDAIVADSGIWEIVVAHDNPQARAIRINAWIQRDDSPLGYPIFGRQSYFDDPLYQRFENDGRLDEFDHAPEPSYVQRITTLNAITTGEKTFVIGGWRESDNSVARYSALGPPLPAARRTSFAPNVIARCDDSVACNGVIAAGTRRGSYVAMNGTSVAAPQVARWIADQFAQGIDVTPSTLAAATTGFADRVPAAFRTAAQGDGVMGDLKSSRPIARSAPRPDFR